MSNLNHPWRVSEINSKKLKEARQEARKRYYRARNGGADEFHTLRARTAARVRLGLPLEAEKTKAWGFIKTRAASEERAKLRTTVQPLRFNAFLMHVHKGMGGHIGIEDSGRSLCGVEFRHPEVEYEQDFSGDRFEPWLQANRPFICKQCIKFMTKKFKRFPNGTVRGPYVCGWRNNAKGGVQYLAQTQGGWVPFISQLADNVETKKRADSFAETCKD